MLNIFDLVVLLRFETVVDVVAYYLFVETVFLLLKFFEHFECLLSLGGQSIEKLVVIFNSMPSMLAEECAISTNKTAIITANDVCGFRVQQTNFILFFGTRLFNYGGFVLLRGLDWFLEQIE